MIFNLFKKSNKKKLDEFLEENKDKVLTLELDRPVDCLCDFTYNFIWQSKFDPETEIKDGISFKTLVEHLKNNGIVYIKGDVGKRFCSSMGVDLKYFGGSGGRIKVGTVIVDGNIDTRFGISMLSGTVYINEKSQIKEPMGNVIEVESDIKGYRKFISITEFVEYRYKDEKLLKPNKFDKNRGVLEINDKIKRDTVGARLNDDKTIIVNGDVDLSTGILMKRGKVIVNGNAGKNTGAVLSGGIVIINGDTDDFTGIEMKDGVIVVDGNAGKFLGAKKKGGVIYARDGKEIPPTKRYELSKDDVEFLKSLGYTGKFYKFV
jgi:formylmethanofuran dehydrogenase subunit C